MSNIESSVNKVQEYLTSFVATDDLALGTNGSQNRDGALIVRKQKLYDKQLFVERKTQPKNREDFNERLNSFTFGSWRNSDVSPLYCVRYGWKLREFEMLQCVTCQALVNSSLPPTYQEDAYKTFLEVLWKRIKAGHKAWCGWPQNPSPEEFSHPPLAFSVYYLENLRNDTSNIFSQGGDLPYINVTEILNKLKLEEWHISTFYPGEKSFTEKQLVASILAMTGWTFEKRQHLKCCVCLRSVGLWNFLPLAEKDEYLTLKERDQEKQRRKAVLLAKRKDREATKRAKEELTRKLEEEKQRLLKEEEKKALEEERKKDERVAKYEEKMREIESMNYENLMSESVQQEVEGVDVEEEEENILLGEKETGKNRKQPLKVGQVMEDDIVTVKVPQEGFNFSENDRNKLISSTDCNVEIENAETIEPQGSRFPEINEMSIDNITEVALIETEIRSGAEIRGGDEVQTEIRGEVQTEIRSDDEVATEIRGDDEKATEIRGDNEVENCNNEDDLWEGALGCVTTSEAIDLSSDAEDHESTAKEDESTLIDMKRKRSVDSSSSSSPKEPPAKRPGCFNQRENSSSSEDSETKNDDRLLTALDVEEDDSDSEDEVEEPLTEEDYRYQQMVECLFDPLEEHRRWCGWVTERSVDFEDNHCQEMENLPGYLILSSHLSSLSKRTSETLVISEKYAKNVDGLREIRSALYNWELSKED